MVSLLAADPLGKCVNSPWTWMHMAPAWTAWIWVICKCNEDNIPHAQLNIGFYGQASQSVCRGAGVLLGWGWWGQGWGGGGDDMMWCDVRISNTKRCGCRTWLFMQMFSPSLSFIGVIYCLEHSGLAHIRHLQSLCGNVFQFYSSSSTQNDSLLSSTQIPVLLSSV